MVILHVTAPAEVGGLESVVRALAIGHRRLGHEVSVAAVLTRPPKGHPFVTALADAGVRVVPIVVPARAYLRERKSVRRLCRTLRPDVVHTHGYRPDAVDAPVAQELALPIVTTVHGFTGGGIKNELYERIQRRAFRKFDAVVAVSRATARELMRAGVPAERLQVVPNAWMGGPDPLDRERARRQLGVPPYRFHVGWVGRLSREKGLDVLIDALALLGDIPMLVSVFGDGRERDAARAHAESAGVATRIIWRGTVPEASRLYPAFDAFVLSSRTEGTPISLFEAMAARAPIVATTVGGIPEVVRTTEAWLVPPESPRTLAAAIRAVYADPVEASRRARAAWQRLAAEYRVAPWLERYESIYRRVRARAPARPEIAVP